jgi:hypothetical protein
MFRITGDPTLDAVIYVLGAFLCLGFLMAGAVIIIPIAIAIVLFKAFMWYVTLPKPTADLMNAARTTTTLAQFPDPEKYRQSFTKRLLEHWGDDLPIKPIMRTTVQIASDLYEAEDLYNPLPPIQPAGDAIAEGRYRDRLLDRLRKTSDPQKTLSVIQKTLGEVAQAIYSALPPMARTDREHYHNEIEPFATVPLLDTIPNIAEVVQEIVLPFQNPEVTEHNLFKPLKAQILKNYEDASGKVGQVLRPVEFKGTPHQLVATYFQGTPFLDIFTAHVPFTLDHRQRTEHHAIYAPPGWGKTQTLERIILNDLEQDDPPSIVLIDSQGDVDGMLRQIQRLKIFAPSERLEERLIIIDPEQYTPALNLFDMQTARLASYSPAHREAVEIGVQDLFSYLFEAMGADLSPRQATAFASAGKLMTKIPNATLTTLRELMLLEPKDLPRSKFATAIETLDTTTQEFFKHQFFSKTLQPTRTAVASRLFAISRYPAFDRMFSAPTNKIDFFQATQEGKIILCNTSRRLLGEGASLFGAWVIAQCLRAAYERAAIPRDKRRFTTLVIDEAVDYFATGDERMQLLLSQARKYQLGVCFATQYLDQMTPSMRSAAATVAIKMAGGVNDKDARSLAPDMRCDSSFITSMRMKPMVGAQFATYVRNYTESAVRLSIPFGTLAEAPKMTERDQEIVIAKNARLYGSIFREREKRDAFIDQVRAAHPHQHPDPTRPVTPPTEAPAPPALPPDVSADKPGDWPLK